MPGARDRQHGRLQARHRHAAAGGQAGARSSRTPACPRASSTWSTARGAEVGEPLVAPPRRARHLVHRLARATGRQVSRRAARRCSSASTSSWAARTPIIVMDDADLDLAVEGILWSAFGTTGQRCTAASPRDRRTERVHDELIDKLVPRVQALRLGNGLDPATDVGPVINRAALDKIAQLRRRSRHRRRGRRGADRRRDRDATASWRAATSTSRRSSATSSAACAIAQEEIFGPVTVDHPRRATWTRRSTIATASSTASRPRSTPRDVNTAFRAMRDLYTGIIYVNAGTIGAEVHLPVRRHQGHRQRPPRGRARPRSTPTREWKSIYVDYSRQAAARPDRQPVTRCD